MVWLRFWLGLGLWLWLWFRFRFWLWLWFRFRLRFWLWFRFRFRLRFWFRFRFRLRFCLRFSLCLAFCLRFCLQNGLAVIPKSRREHRLRENAAIFDFEIPDPEMQILNGLAHGTAWRPRSVLSADALGFATPPDTGTAREL